MARKKKEPEKIEWTPFDLKSMPRLMISQSDRAYFHQLKFQLHQAYADDWQKVIDEIDIKHDTDCKYY